MEQLIIVAFDFLLQSLFVPLLCMAAVSVLINLLLAIFQIQEQSAGYLAKLATLFVFLHLFGYSFFEELSQLLDQILETFKHVGDSPPLLP